MGLPGLQGKDKERVDIDNDAAEFILGELASAQSRGVASIRENPHNSLHWFTPSEVSMFNQGTWWDTLYHACALQGSRRKAQRLRHDVLEIS